MCGHWLISQNPISCNDRFPAAVGSAFYIGYRLIEGDRSSSQLFGSMSARAGELTSRRNAVSAPLLVICVLLLVTRNRLYQEENVLKATITAAFAAIVAAAAPGAYAQTSTMPATHAALTSYDSVGRGARQ
jgi:hypothetical protein